MIFKGTIGSNACMSLFIVISNYYYNTIIPEQFTVKAQESLLGVGV